MKKGRGFPRPFKSQRRAANQCGSCPACGSDAAREVRVAADALADTLPGDLTTVALTARLRRWRAEGDDVALLIGGPDGLSPALKSRAHELIRLSSLTLPHALARLLLAEALYRAVSLEANHPYHRE